MERKQLIIGIILIAVLSVIFCAYYIVEWNKPAYYGVAYDPFSLEEYWALSDIQCEVKNETISCSYMHHSKNYEFLYTQDENGSFSSAADIDDVAHYSFMSYEDGLFVGIVRFDGDTLGLGDSRPFGFIICDSSDELSSITERIEDFVMEMQ